MARTGFEGSPEMGGSRARDGSKERGPSQKQGAGEKLTWWDRIWGFGRTSPRDYGPGRDRHGRPETDGRSSSSKDK